MLEIEKDKNWNETRYKCIKLPHKQTETERGRESEREDNLQKTKKKCTDKDVKGDRRRQKRAPWVGVHVGALKFGHKMSL